MNRFKAVLDSSRGGVVKYAPFYVLSCAFLAMLVTPVDPLLVMICTALALLVVLLSAGNPHNPGANPLR